MDKRVTIRHASRMTSIIDAPVTDHEVPRRHRPNGKIVVVLLVVSAAAAGFLIAGCSDSPSKVFSARVCADGGYVQLSELNGVASPTGKAFVRRCDFNAPPRATGALPIEVYAQATHGEAIGWLYAAKCGFPRGLVSVGASAPDGCASGSTTASTAGS